MTQVRKMLFRCACLFASERLFGSVILLLLWGAAAICQDSPHLDTVRGPVSASSQQMSIRANVDLVLVNVTVLNRDNRPVTGLRKSDFTVLDDNNPKNLKYISGADEPVSVVVIFDASASMKSKIAVERTAVKELINNSNSEDEFSLIIVSDKPRVAFDFGDPINHIEPGLDTVQAEGNTALWDGMFLAVQQIRSSHNQRKALVVISDGGDNHSRYTESELKRVLAEADVEMYAVGIFDRLARKEQSLGPLQNQQRDGPLQLDELSNATGGRLFSVYDPREVTRAMAQIGAELRNHYVLGYYSGNEDRNGKWHKLKVRVSEKAGSKFRVQAKKGYYAAVP